MGEGDVSREMTLREWINKLPNIHRVQREFADLEAKLAEAITEITTLTESYEKAADEYHADINGLHEKLFEARSDADENYIQGIGRGSLVALKAIRAMPLDEGNSKMDNAIHLAIRASCMEAINRAVDAATIEQRAKDRAINDESRALPDAKREGGEHDG